MQITSAMKMVSAAKLKRAQDAILQMRPYSDKLTELLNNLISSIDSSENNIYSKKRKLNSVLLVTITSNRGLCGGFNSFIIKQAKALIKNEYKNTNVSILSIGKKSSEHFTKNSFNVVGTYDDLLSDITYDGTCKIAEKIMIEFVDGKYDKVVLVYNQFKNAATQIVKSETFCH